MAAAAASQPPTTQAIHQPAAAAASQPSPPLATRCRRQPALAAASQPPMPPKMAAAASQPLPPPASRSRSQPASHRREQWPKMAGNIPRRCRQPAADAENGRRRTSQTSANGRRRLQLAAAAASTQPRMPRRRRCRPPALNDASGPDPISRRQWEKRRWPDQVPAMKAASKVLLRVRVFQAWQSILRARRDFIL
ncbi:uncharacterized protein LOC143823362 [Paroedura picta]|uniref:uncharacterized protein LOC143823362 n=1 Tax=Paroedura picta TaxID=143630 RepID=UPI004057105B